MVSHLIFDVGMHDGSDAAYYLSLGFSVVGVEANPELVDKAKVRFATEIAEGRMTVESGVVADFDGETDFFLHSKDAGQSSVFNFQEANHYSSIRLPTIRFGNLLSKHGVPYYLKVDIEGSEKFVLRELSPDNRPQYVSIEVRELEPIFLLYNLGYRKFKVSDQTRMSMVSHGQWKFTAHSSGPFGEDLSGEWEPLEIFLLQWLKFGAGEKSSFAPHHWYDLHASL